MRDDKDGYDAQISRAESVVEGLNESINEDKSEGKDTSSLEREVERQEQYIENLKAARDED